MSNTQANNYATLECSGIGANAFLQGQLTCNLNELNIDQPILTACCNIQGRVIFTAIIIMKNNQQFLLHLPQSMLKIAHTHLDKYAKFSKCVISEVSNADQYLMDSKQNILKGIPMIYPETSEQIIPQRLNLHLINGAMSFKKGCYLGQEIISRLHFKGKLKHHMYLGVIQKTLSLVIGEKIFNADQEESGLIVDYLVDIDQTLLLFVNAIENKSPQLKDGSAIACLPLPYSFKDEV